MSNEKTCDSGAAAVNDRATREREGAPVVTGGRLAALATGLWLVLTWFVMVPATTWSEPASTWYIVRWWFFAAVPAGLSWVLFWATGRFRIVVGVWAALVVAYLALGLYVIFVVGIH